MTPKWHKSVTEAVISARRKAPSDPVYQTTGGWYFADEVWAESFGPFATEAEARDSLRRYADSL